MLSLSFLLLAAIVHAEKISYGHGALIYDASIQSLAPFKLKNNPGFWSKNIANFNLLGKNQINRLYVYGQSFDPNTFDASSWYNTSFASQSIGVYRRDFPNAQIFINIDGNYVPNDPNDPKKWPQDLSTYAHQIALQICQVEAIDGIFFDIEQFSPSSEDDTLFKFYLNMRNELQSDFCKDTKHVNGRMMGVFGYLSRTKAEIVKSLFNQGNVFNAIPLYDLDIGGYPDSPPKLCDYSATMKGVLNTAISNATNYQIPFSLIVSAAASFSIYESVSSDQTCSDKPQINFESQHLYINEILALINHQPSINGCQFTISDFNQPELYLGMDFWAWNNFLTPDKKNYLYPSYPSQHTLEILSNMNDKFANP